VITTSYLCYEGTHVLIQSTVRPFLVTGYLRLSMKKAALLLFLILWSLLLMAQGAAPCTPPTGAHLACGTSTAHQAFESCNQHLQEAASLSRDGQDREPMSGYIIDHVKPLECGGIDAPSNMQWQTSTAAKAKDRTEAQCR